MYTEHGYPIPGTIHVPNAEPEMVESCGGSAPGSLLDHYAGTWQDCDVWS